MDDQSVRHSQRMYCEWWEPMTCHQHERWHVKRTISMCNQGSAAPGGSAHDGPVVGAALKGALRLFRYSECGTPYSAKLGVVPDMALA
jgi:hypothetical protein